MKKNTVFIMGVSVLVLTFTVLLTACSKKAEAQNGGGSAGGGNAAKNSGGGKANPATDFKYDLTADGKGIVITDYTGGRDVVIPATIEDMPVVEIGGKAFYQKGVASVFIPASVVKIADGSTESRTVNKKTEFYYPAAFSYNYPTQSSNGLAKVTFSEGLKEIGDYAFYRDSALTAVNLPASLERIGDSAFSNNSKVTTVTLPASLKRIGKGAFFNCGELTELVIPDTLTAVQFDEGEYHEEFSHCGKLPLKTRQRLKDLGYKGEF